MSQLNEKVVWLRCSVFIVNFQNQPFADLPQHKKWSFSLGISSVNVTKSVSHLVKKSLAKNFIFLCSVLQNKCC